MLRSGNDAAVAIANTVAGSLDGFVYLMNEYATIIGMKNTNLLILMALIMMALEIHLLLMIWLSLLK